MQYCIAFLAFMGLVAAFYAEMLRVEVDAKGTCNAVFDGRDMRCAVGKGGAAAPGAKVEGDGKTPVGVFPLRRGFYRKDRVSAPVSDFSLYATIESDGWCDDSMSSLYNQPVTIPETRCSSAENLWRTDGLYDLVAVVEYNTDPVKTGKGSAIFLHVASGSFSPTAGCVALSLEDLEFVLANHVDAIEIATKEDATFAPGTQRWVFNTTAA
jgi:L,D-peptidoglycan transpeptidase YkuD (ErfK/YbiS/YcfS/YnhG family)